MAVNLASGAILTAVSLVNWATAAPTPATLSQLERGLNDIGIQVEALNAALTTFEKGDTDAFAKAIALRDAGYKLISMLGRATTVAKGLTPKPVSIADGLRILGVLSGFVPYITDSMAKLRAKRSDFATLSPQLVQAFWQSSDLIISIGLVTLQKQYLPFQAAMLQLAPDAIQVQAKVLATSVARSLSETITAFESTDNPSDSGNDNLGDTTPEYYIVAAPDNIPHS